MPSLINYQGKLTDASNNPLPNGTYGVAVRLWSKKDNAQPGNTLVWGQEYNVALLNGIFDVILGAPGGTPVTNTAVNDLSFAFTDAERYFGLTITKGTNGVAIPGAVEIVPRQQVLSGAYALRAGTSDLAVTVPDGSITTSKIANGIVGFVPHNIQVFTSSATWTQPSGVSNVYVKVIGRGGNGGSGGGSSVALGGGGGGGYSEGIIAVAGNATVTIGAINSFSGSTTIQATSGSDATGETGGAGGIGIGGAINLPGGAGQTVSSYTVNTTGGMGGASAMGAGGSGGGYSSGGYSPATKGAKFGGGGGGKTNIGTSETGDPGAVIVYY